jgi:Flp pilus assembly protein TadD
MRSYFSSKKCKDIMLSVNHVKQLKIQAIEQIDSGHYGEALETLRQASYLRPDDIEIWMARGAACSRLYLLAEATTSFNYAIKLEPDNIAANVAFANASFEQRKMIDALVGYQHVIRLNPRDAHAYARSGMILQGMKRYVESVSHYKKTLELNPKQPLVCLNFGIIREELKQYTAAETMYLEALRLQPDLVDAISHLAYLYEKQQRFDEAAVFVNKGIKIAPDYSSLLLTQAKLKQRDGFLHEAIALLEKSLQLNAEKELLGEINSRLGYLYDQTGNYHKAFSRFIEGNCISEKLYIRRDVDKNDFLIEVDEMSAFLKDIHSSKTNTIEKNHLQTDRIEPVFLVGFPRSGTTLLDKILNSHPRLQSLEEKPAVFNMRQEFKQVCDQSYRENLTLKSEANNKLKNTYYETVGNYMKLVPGNILIDKFPLNIVYTPVIWRAFPNAKFILALRHPCDACLSCFMQSFGTNTAMANFTSLENTADLYSKVMNIWQDCCNLLNLNYHIVKYENMVTDLVSEVADVLRFLDVGWDSAVLQYQEYAKKQGIIETPSYHQVTQPIYNHACYRWLHYKDHFEPVLETLSPYIEYFGYNDSSHKN